MKSKLFRVLTFACGLMAFLPSIALQEAPPTFTFDGRAYANSAATTPMLDLITTKIQILNSAQDCILYEESQSLNTTASNGYFTIQIGSVTGNAKRSANDSNNTMSNVFSNTAASITGKLISNGALCTYIPAGGDKRYVRIQMTPASDGVTRTISPNMALDSVPSAMVAERAETLQGLGPANLLQVQNSGSNVLTQANLESVFTTTLYPNLMNLLAVPAANYVQTGGNGSATLPIISGNPGSGLSAGQIWYDSSANLLKYYDGTVKTVGTSGGSVTSVAGGTGLVGGPITTTGTLSVDVGTTAGKIVQVQTGGKLPVLDGSNLTNVTAASGYIDGGNAFGAAATIGTTDNYNLGVKTNNVTRMTIDAAGYVGIGTTGPSTRFSNTSVPFAGGTATDALSWRTTENDWAAAIVAAPATGAGYSLRLHTNGATNNDYPLYISSGPGFGSGLLAVKGDGNVGVGTTAPGVKLEVAGPIANANETLGVAKFFDGGSQPYFVIRTKIPWLNNGAAGGMAAQVRIRGYGYGASDFDTTLSWYEYNNTFYSLGNVTKFHSAIGKRAPSRIRMGVWDDAGTNRIAVEVANDGIYWSSYFVDAYGHAAFSSLYTSGWTTSAGAFDGTYSNITNIPQAGNVVQTYAGNVGIGTPSPAAKLHVGSAPIASSNYPLFALGTAPYDGVTGGFFTGSANGTFIGVNAAAGFTGDFAHFQVAGVSKYKIDNTGNLTVSGMTTSSGNYSTSGNISTTATGTITSAGAIMANSGAASTSPITGSLIVTGGAGISGTLNVGADIIANGNISAASGTAAVAGTNQNSPLLYLTANYWNGAVSSVDQWSLQNILGAGTNPTSTLVFSHAGTTGSSRYAFMDGNVGIGTTAPTAKLDVVGNITSSGTIYSSNFQEISNNGMQLYSPYNSINPYIDLYGGWAATGRLRINTSLQAIYPTVAGGWHLGTSTYPMGNGYFSGNLGIGTTGPTAKLNIDQGNVTNSWGLALTNVGPGTTGIRIDQAAGGSLQMGNLYGMPFYLRSTNRSMRFEVLNNAYDSAPQAFLFMQDSPATRTLTVFQGAAGQSADLMQFQDSTTAIVGKVTSAGGAYFAGNVGIGTTGFGGSKLAIRDDMDGLATVSVHNSSATSGAIARFGANTGGAWITMEQMAGAYVGTGGREANFSAIHSSGSGINLVASQPAAVLRMYTGGEAAANERLRVTSAGNVGIGTTGPGYQLEVGNSVGIGTATGTFGDKIIFNNGYKINTFGGGGIGIQGGAYVRIQSSSGFSGASFSPGYAGAPGLTMVPMDATQVPLEIRGVASQTGDLFQVTSSGGTAGDKFTILSNGNVGIGTISPQAKLSVNGNIQVAKNSAQPHACDATHDAIIALTSQYTTCVCNGGATTWVRTSDGVTICAW